MAAPFNPNTMQTARRLLQAGNLPVTPEATRLMAGWVQAEGGLANSTNNPLNTTLQAPGSLDAMNSSGVRNYATLDQGINADVTTLNNPRYASIRRALSSGSQPNFINALGSSPWGTGRDLISRVLGGAAPAAPTQTPKVPSKTLAMPTSPQQPVAPAIDETDAQLRGEFAQLMSGGKVRPIDLLTGGMYAADQASAMNAQRAADLARQSATVQQQTTPVSPSAPAGGATGANPPAPNTKGAARATSWALNNLGIPYSWGGGTPTGPTKGFAQGAKTVGYDCSSFVQAAMTQAGVKLPRTTYEQMKVGAPVSNLATAQPGDLLFPSAGHVMLYLGNGKAAEAPHTGDVTKTLPVTGMSFVSIRRVL